MSAGDLKPCPFCGGQAHMHYDPKSGMFGPISEHASGCPIMAFDLVDYCDEHAAIAEWNTRALADRLEAREGWRGIESAPRDGTPFDAWVPDAFGGRRMTGLSFNRRGQLRQHGLLTAAELPRWPTHWMPLPPAPGAEKKS